MAGAVLTALLLVALSRRWFARFQNGFFLATAAAVVTVGLLAAALAGAWGYDAARGIMAAELTASLDSVASIVQQQTELEIDRANDRMEGLARAAVGALQPGGDLRDLTTSLQTVQDFNSHYLEIDVLDVNGRRGSRRSPSASTPTTSSSATSGRDGVSSTRASATA